jgi:drug/metabolite transporter (DMT)-like permease
MRHRYGWELAIVAVTVGWGATFVLVQNAVAIVPVMYFLAVRFGIAAALLALLRPRDIVRATRRDLVAGATAGLFLFASYAFQTAGLQFASSSSVGFITGLYVVIVPFFAAVAFRRLPSRASLIAVALATAGLFLLANPSSGRFGKGELFALLCAASFAAQILIVDRVAKRVDLIPFTAAQLLTVAACAAFGIPFSGPAGNLGAARVWEAVAFTAVFASALGYLVQSAAQRRVPPTRSAILFAMESPFAALFGLWFAHDHIGIAGWVGGGLMVAGVLVTETKAPAVEDA